MSKREGPETEVGGSVGDATEDELDGVDDLVDDDLIELKVLFLIIIATVVVVVVVLFSLLGDSDGGSVGLLEVIRVRRVTDVGVDDLREFDVLAGLKGLAFSSSAALVELVLHKQDHWLGDEHPRH